jgi:hypothetical protein
MGIKTGCARAHTSMLSTGLSPNSPSENLNELLKGLCLSTKKTRLDKKLMKIFLDQKVFGTDLLRECSSLRQCLTLPTNYMTSRNRVNFWLELDLCVGFQTHTCKSHIILSFIFFWYRDWRNWRMKGDKSGWFSNSSILFGRLGNSEWWP